MIDMSTKLILELFSLITILTLFLFIFVKTAKVLKNYFLWYSLQDRKDTYKYALNYINHYQKQLHKEDQT